MNPRQQQNWKDEVLQHILAGVASSPHLREALIFKGARILSFHLHTQRQSLDIDSTLTVEFQRSHQFIEEQAQWFQQEIHSSLSHYFEGQDPVRFSLEHTKVTPTPPPSHPHPRGWGMLVVRLSVKDALQAGVRTLPALEIEIAAPEDLGPSAVEEITLHGVPLRAYSLSRIAGEKLRAFLTSLPHYRHKMDSQERAVRAKDLFDLSCILAARPIADTTFWKTVATEFVLACQSRFVDCEGQRSFQENWPATRQAYENDATLRPVPWAEAEASLLLILQHFTETGVFPLRYPLPD